MHRLCSTAPATSPPPKSWTSFLQIRNKNKQEHNLKHCLVVEDEDGSLLKYAIQDPRRDQFANAIFTTFGLDMEWRRQKWRNISKDPYRYRMSTKKTCLAHLVNKTTNTYQWQSGRKDWACVSSSTKGNVLCTGSHSPLKNAKGSILRNLPTGFAQSQHSIEILIAFL